MSVYEATEALVAAVRSSLFARTADDLIADPGMGAVDAALNAYDDAKAAERKALQATTDHLNAFLRRQLGGGGPHYRYFEHKGVRYCWNTKPLNEPDGKWFAWEYRQRKGSASGSMRLEHRVKCATRTKAKEKARAWVRAAEAR